VWRITPGRPSWPAAIERGLWAARRGHEEIATGWLGRAVALAHHAGNEEAARLLAEVVDVVDEAAGAVRLKEKADAADEMALDTRSTKTVRVQKGIAMATCPSGHESASDDFCDVCGVRMGGATGLAPR